MESKRAVIAVYSLRRACCHQQPSVTQVSISHDTRSRALVGPPSLQLDFICDNCRASRTRMNVCVHFLGLQWENMYSSPVQDDTTSFGWLCCLILADSFIYFLIAWYVRNVFPGTNMLALDTFFLWFSPLYIGKYIFSKFDLPYIIFKEKYLNPELTKIFQDEVMCQ